MIKFNNDIYPLPWLGGKRRIVRRFVDRLMDHLTPGTTYIEPFAGGLSVALTLLDILPWLRVRVNDAHRPVYAYWKTIRDNPQSLIERVRREHPERGAWNCYKSQSQAHDGLSDSDLCWATYARYGWSFCQKGAAFNPGFGSRTYLATRERQIRAAHRLLQRAEITNLDFRQVMKGDEGVTYLDPPYMVATGSGNYYDHQFSHVDSLDLRDIVLAKRAPWLMSYDDHPAVWNRYQTCDIKTIVFGRGLGGPTREYRELLIAPKS